MDFLMWLQHTSFATWVHESTSLFSFPGILLLHTIGMALVVGIAAAIDLRILGFAPALPLAPMERFLPVLWAGFWVNAVTGTVLFAVDATAKATSPDFWIKMAFIALAVVNLRLIQKRVLATPTSIRDRCRSRPRCSPLRRCSSGWAPSPRAVCWPTWEPSGRSSL